MVRFTLSLLIFASSISAHGGAADCQLFTSTKSIFDSVRELRHSKKSAKADQALDQLTRYLEKGKIKKIKYQGGGVNQSFRIKFENGISAIFKPQLPDRKNLIHREVAAYRLSRLMGLDIVPPTTIRTLRGDNIPADLQGVKGSLQFFITDGNTLEKHKVNKQKSLRLHGNDYDIEGTPSGRRLIIFDWLINNHDRGSNAGNYFIADSDGYVYGIDHSVSFVGHDKQARSDKVPYYKKEFLKDLKFYELITSASESDIRDALEDLNPVRIDEFFERFEKLKKDFREVLDI